jgi:hypothetical protein
MWKYFKNNFKPTNLALRHEVWESGCIVPPIRDLGSSLRWVVSFTPRPLYFRGKGFRAHWTGGWVSPGTCLDNMERRKKYINDIDVLLACALLFFLQRSVCCWVIPCLHVLWWPVCVCVCVCVGTFYSTSYEGCVVSYLKATLIRIWNVLLLKNWLFHTWFLTNLYPRCFLSPLLIPTKSTMRSANTCHV